MYFDLDEMYERGDISRNFYNLLNHNKSTQEKFAEFVNSRTRENETQYLEKFVEKSIKGIIETTFKSLMK